MSETYSLAAASREESGRAAADAIRSESKIPAVMYGHGVESRALTVDSVEFTKLFEAAGESSLINLSVDGGEAVQVVIHDIQRDPVKYTITHADLYQVRMDEKMTAEVELVFEGIAPAVKNLGGIMVKNKDHIEIECLPKDLVHDLKVDISTLATFDDTIRVKDIVLPEGVVTTLDGELPVVSVTPPRSAEELESLDDEVVEDVESVGDVEEKKSDDDSEEAAE